MVSFTVGARAWSDSKEISTLSILGGCLTFEVSTTARSPEPLADLMRASLTLNRDVVARGPSITPRAEEASA